MYAFVIVARSKYARYFEVVGLASTGQYPYDAIARELVEGRVTWFAPRVLGSNADVRRRRALATVAQVGGLLLVRHVLGAEAGDAAAREPGKLS